MTTYRVVIRSFEDESYEHVIGTGKTKRTADRICEYAEINLDHENYYVSIEEETQ